MYLSGGRELETGDQLGRCNPGKKDYLNLSTSKVGRETEILKS